MKKTILLLGAVGVLMMTGCADEGITTDYGEWVATSEYSMDGTTENYRTIEVDATAEKTEAASEKETEESSDQMDAQKKAAATLHDVRSAMKINYFDADGLENDYK